MLACFPLDDSRQVTKRQPNGEIDGQQDLSKEDVPAHERNGKEKPRARMLQRFRAFRLPMGDS